MLGIMMNPENIAEFYAASKKTPEQQQKIFVEKPQKPKISYLRDGRVLINGEVKQCQKSADLWNDTLKRSVARQLQVKSISKQRSQSLCDVSMALAIKEEGKKRISSSSEEFLEDLIVPKSEITNGTRVWKTKLFKR